MKVIPHPKLKRDYAGKNVRILRDVRNGFGTIKAGSIAIVTSQSPKGSNLRFISCTACGSTPSISQIKHDDIEFVELEQGDIG